MIKISILFFVIGVALAENVIYTYPVGHLGYSSQYHAQDVAGNYAFGYNQPRYPYGAYHHESGSAGGAKVGSYGVRSADGKVQIVDYTADSAGFRANIKTNQKGVDTEKTPAAVSIQEVKVEDPKFPVFPGAYIVHYKR